jgi:hypothetical protein
MNNIETDYIKFVSYTKGTDGEYPESLVEITLGFDSTLPEILDKFGDFLRGAGYVFNGNVDIVN